MARKIGEGSLLAFRNLGMAELRQASSIEGSVAQPTPYGMWGNPTPGEIAETRSTEALIDDHEPYAPEREHGMERSHGRSR